CDFRAGGGNAGFLDGLMNESQDLRLPRGQFRHVPARLFIQSVLWMYTGIADAVQSFSRLLRRAENTGGNAAINQSIKPLQVCDLTMFRSLLRRARGGLNQGLPARQSIHVASFTSAVNEDPQNENFNGYPWGRPGPGPDGRGR